MELSLFLAKLFGLYMLVVGLLWLVRGSAITEAVEAFFDNRALLFLSGLLALAVGLAIAISHSVWEASYRGAITFFGYASIAKGIARIAFPELPRKAALGLMKGSRKWGLIAATVLIGAWLTWRGFAG